jgi:hypothetical protein
MIDPVETKFLALPADLSATRGLKSKESLKDVGICL